MCSLFVFPIFFLIFSISHIISTYIYILDTVLRIHVISFRILLYIFVNNNCEQTLKIFNEIIRHIVRIYIFRDSRLFGCST